MSSIGSLLNTARNAMTAQQTAILVTSNNVANADVEGYSRQVAQLVTAPATRDTAGFIGSGVLARDVVRVRDSLLDSSFRRNTSSAAEQGLREDLVGRVSDVFGPLAGDGIDKAIDDFFNSWSDLANNPGSAPAKRLVRLSGEQLAATFRDAAARLDQVRVDSQQQLGRDVEQLNGQLEQVATLNREVRLAEANGQSAPALRDERDRVLDQLSSLVNVQVISREDGSAAVALDGTMVVDGDSSRAVEVRPGQPLVLGINGRPTAIRTPGGQLGASLSVLNGVIPETSANLDGLARAMATSINSLHSLGSALATGGGTATGLDFFEVPAVGPDAITASNMKLAAAIDSDASNIAAGYAANGTGTGDNTLALAMAALRTSAVTITTGTGAAAESMDSTFGAFHAQIIAGLGQIGRAASQSATVYSTLASQADNRRSSVSGVSTDEELTQLMHQQQAYAAAARLVSIADEMARTVIDLGR